VESTKAAGYCYVSQDGYRKLQNNKLGTVRMDSHPRLKQTYISQAKKQKDEKYTQRNVR